MSLKAFVTGASGFVGSNLARELNRQGWRTTVLVRASSSLEDLQDLDLDIQVGDIVDAGSVRRAMPDQVDGVFHVAASTNVWAGNNDEQDRINIDGTRNVMEAAIAAGARRFILTSSYATWGFQNTRINEHSPRSRDNDWINYVRSKRIAEDLVKAAAAEGRLDAVILNPAHILGPGDRHNWSQMIRMIATDSLPAVPPGSGPFADVREVAKAHVAAFHQGENGQNYILGGVQAQFSDVLQIVGDLLGKEVPQRVTPAWLLRLIAHAGAAAASITRRPPRITPESALMICHHSFVDSTRAITVLDYRETALRPLLEDTVNWMRKAGLLS